MAKAPKQNPPKAPSPQTAAKRKYSSPQAEPRQGPTTRHTPSK